MQGATGVPGGSVATEDTPGTRVNVPASNDLGTFTRVPGGVFGGHRPPRDPGGPLH